MSRIRSVHPAICDDDVLADLTAYAERTFVRLWTEMDDDGRAIDNPKLLKAKLYPLHDSMTADRVEKDLAELCEAGLLQRYEVDGKRYLAAKEEAWRRYQKPRHPTPSKLPPPPRNGTVPADGGSPTAHRRNPPAGEGVERERRGLGAEGESEGEAPVRRSDAAPVDNPGRLEAKAQQISQRLHVVNGGAQPSTTNGKPPEDAA